MLEDQYLGCLLGLACGDALGAAVEFAPRGSFIPVTEMRGDGPYNLPPGYWTDDTSMALCLGTSLIEKRGFDPSDQLRRYVDWWLNGTWSSTDECFDIGTITREALRRFNESQDAYCGSVNPKTAGNGSLMRLAPVPMLYRTDPIAVDRYAADSSRTTHGAPEAIDCCRLMAAIIVAAFNGVSKTDVLLQSSLRLSAPKVVALATGDYLNKVEIDIKGSGYCVESLEAALWCFAQTTSLQQCVLKAVNLGDDADTTAAIAGQVAGAFYGVQAIPKSWLKTLRRADDIENIARSLFAASNTLAPNQ